MFAPPTAIYTHGTGLTTPLVIEMPVPDQESEWSFICVLGIFI
jgi:hypothetical protein